MTSRDSSEHDTLELPPDLLVTAPDATEPQAQPPHSPRPPRKRRWGLRIGLIIAAVVVLAAAAELALRVIIPNVIASTIRENLGLPSSHPVEVELSGWALPNALTGRVGQVSVTVPDTVVFEGIEATLSASASSMPFDPTTGNIEDATASVSIPSSSMSSVVSLATDGLADTAEISGGELVVGRTVDLFGLQVTLTAALEASVDRGDLLIEPTRVNAAGFNLSAEQLRGMLGDSMAAVLDVHRVCVRDQLPAGIALTDLTLSPTALGGATATVTVALDPDVLSNPVKQEPGTCASE